MSILRGRLPINIYTMYYSYIYVHNCLQTNAELMFSKRLSMHKSHGHDIWLLGDYLSVTWYNVQW